MERRKFSREFKRLFGVTPVEAYFHASCGGRTESGAAALDRPFVVVFE